MRSGLSADTKNKLSWLSRGCAAYRGRQCNWSFTDDAAVLSVCWSRRSGSCVLGSLLPLSLLVLLRDRLLLVK